MTQLSSEIDVESMIKTIFNGLKYGSDDLKGVLNQDVKLLSYSIDGDLLKLNFNKKFLDVTLQNEESMQLNRILNSSADTVTL